MIERLCATLVMALARTITGVRADWRGCLPEERTRIYYANHASHGDFVLIWTVLPAAIRERTRPVAGADYWCRGRLRSFLGQRVFKAVLIDREHVGREANPITAMASAMDEGNSLILFPEGTRNTTSERLLPFKSGLYHLALRRREVELVPVWIENLNRVMPKGEAIPLPLLCTVTFGAPLLLAEGERKQAFLERSRDALLALAPAGATA